MVGRVLGDRYRIDEMLGRGGMAAVWRGRDLRLDRPVAIKVLAAAEASDPKAFERFDREAHIVAQLAHPNIVAVYDFGTDQGDPYLVMEFVEGRGVAAMLAGGPLPVAEVLAIVAQTCDALSAAHAAGVVHRDIKPANLIVTSAGVAKICDFGIARLQHAAGQATLTGTATAIGTAAYMAPEQVERGPIDARTDLYALGCTMYSMLTGSPPFTGESPQSVLQQHVSSPPVSLRMRRPDIPIELDELVGDLLAKSPSDRPSDAEKVKARLLALASSSAESAKSEMGAADPRPRDRVDSKRRPIRVGTVGAAIGVFAALVLLVGSFALANVGRAGSAAWQDPLWTEGLTPTVVSEPSPTTMDLPISVGSAAAPRMAPAPTTPAPPADPIADMRMAIQQQVQTGQLNPAAAPDLQGRVDEIVKEINQGDVKTARDKVTALRQKLSDLNREGKLSSAGYGVLSAKVDLIADLLT
jgi:serine/threonine-protein kinase